jgi:acetolactate synthase-1/2/3 large subunit
MIPMFSRNTKRIMGFKRFRSTNFNRYFSSTLDRRQKYIGMTGGRIIYEKLLENNVKVANGFSGGANLPILDCFHPFHHNGKTPIEFITNSNEGNTGYVAEGYAKVSGEPGIIMVTSGPGLTNIITPLQDALCDGVPLVAFSGQVAQNAPPDAFQSCDSVDLTRPCTKWNYKLKCIEELPTILDYAFHMARSGRPGPVHIDCPKDIQVTTLTEEHLDNFKKINIDGLDHHLNDEGNLEFNKIHEIPELNDSQLDTIVDLINKSEKPILSVGQGVNDCSKELLEFVEKTNIPITTTLHSLGSFDERHPLALNMIGMHGHPTPNFMIQEADLILAVGSRFDDRTVGKLNSFAINARNSEKKGKGGIVHVDIRPTEKDRVVKVTEFVHSDCKSFLTEMNKKNIITKPRTEWLDSMNNYKKNNQILIPTYADGSLSVQRVIEEMNSQIEPYREKCIFSTGVGVHQMVAAQLITWVNPRSMISSGSLGTMGVSLGYAIGAKLADKNKIVISIDGDGSFNMTNTELKTIMDLQIPVKILLVNNNSEMMVEYWQKLFFEGRYISTDNNNCDYNKLAEAYGIKNLYCDNEKDLKEKMDEFLDYKGPILFHVKINKTPCLPLVSPGKSIDNMILNDTGYDDIDRSEVPS